MSDGDEMVDSDFEYDDDYDADMYDDMGEEEENDYDIEFDPPVGKLTRNESFEVLDESFILAETSKMVTEVMDVLGIPNKSLATILLRKQQWNSEKLISRWLEDEKKVLKEIGMKDLQLEKKPTTKKKIPCAICMEDVRPSKTFALSCGHRYCLDCWSGYLGVTVESGGSECITAECPYPKCKVIVHEEAFKRSLSEKQFAKYSEFLLKSFVDDNPQVKWCPAPGCTYCVRTERKNRKESVTCKCGYRYCFNCNDSEIGDHVPCPCDWIDNWFKKASDESENVTWMLANTKKCPVCRSPIEKNGGCMHMTCKKNGGGCGYEFCWLCRGAWSEHGSATGGYYNCNKYDKSKAKEEDEKSVDAKTELEYYMFYYHRYESHKNALKIADQQRESCDKKEEDILVKFDVRSADTKFLIEAVETIIESRRVLQYSYCYGFYLEKASQEKNLFEYLQEDLEKHTNHLSTLYEATTEKIGDYHAFIQWKEEVTNYTRVTKKFLDHFVEGIHGGLTSENL